MALCVVITNHSRLFSVGTGASARLLLCCFTRRAIRVLRKRTRVTEKTISKTVISLKLSLQLQALTASLEDVKDGNGGEEEGEERREEGGEEALEEDLLWGADGTTTTTSSSSVKLLLRSSSCLDSNNLTSFPAKARKRRVRRVRSLLRQCLI